MSLLLIETSFEIARTLLTLIYIFIAFCPILLIHYLTGYGLWV